MARALIGMLEKADFPGDAALARDAAELVAEFHRQFPRAKSTTPTERVYPRHEANPNAPPFSRSGRPRRLKRCDACGKDFYGFNICERNFCSTKCWNHYAKSSPIYEIEAECAICSKPFTTVRWHERRTCSEECRCLLIAKNSDWRQLEQTRKAWQDKTGQFDPRGKRRHPWFSGRPPDDKSINQLPRWP